MNARILLLSFFFLMCGCFSLQAQELSGSFGLMQTPDLHQSSYSYEFDYRQDFTRNVEASLGWINEGHVSAHRRDGYAWEAWFTWPTWDDRLCYSIGAGPYYYFDTQRLPGGGTTDVHGTAPIFSFSATFYSDDRWFARFTVNRINPAHDIKVNTASFGVGYWLGRGTRPLKQNFGDPLGADYVTANEVTVFGGISVQNTFFDERAGAAALEYRHGMFPHVDWTASYIYEGDPHVIRRNGVAIQVWPVNAFRKDRLTVGMGFGIYASVDRKSIARLNQYHAPTLSPLVSPTLSVRLSDEWLVRAIFNRVVSYDKPDSDVFLLGLGYRWR